MVTRFTQEIIPFHLALCKFWKEKFITCFHFRSSSKSTYFPNRKILIQNSYLASSEMGSTPWKKWTWRFFLSFSNSNFHFLLNFEKIGDPNEPCMSSGILQVKIAFSSPLIGTTRRRFCEGNKFSEVTSGKKNQSVVIVLNKTPLLRPGLTVWVRINKKHLNLPWLLPTKSLTFPAPLERDGGKWSSCHAPQFLPGEDKCDSQLPGTRSSLFHM